MKRTLLLAGLCTSFACSTVGSNWMAQPLPDDGFPAVPSGAGGKGSGPKSPRASALDTRTLSDEESERGAKNLSDEPLRPVRQLGGKLEGKVLGKFRNTYYDFPSESEHTGPAVALKNAECQTIKDVPKGFYEAVCVQGSGTLAGGQTVSFAKRDCSCAAVCSKTGQNLLRRAGPEAVPLRTRRHGRRHHTALHGGSGQRRDPARDHGLHSRARGHAARRGVERAA